MNENEKSTPHNITFVVVCVMLIGR